MKDLGSDAAASPNPPAAELLEALAARCEREEPTWQLDDAIAQAALGLPPCGTAGPRPYTSSLDAAITLVPEGFVWGVETFCGSAARVIGPEDEKEGSVPQGYSDTFGVKTAAAALCAASLRGRAALVKAGA